MDCNRAREISSSPEMMKVTYKGVPVYIENVNADGVTANIHPLENSRKSRRVNVINLVEH